MAPFGFENRTPFEDATANHGTSGVDDRYSQRNSWQRQDNYRGGFGRTHDGARPYSEAQKHAAAVAHKDLGRVKIKE